MQDRVTTEVFEGTDTAAIARDLLGKLLVVPAGNGRRVSGVIVECEAYLGEIDRAAHSFGGRRTARTEVMYAPAGHVYVFFVYGMHYQLNFVCGPADHPHAILIRAIEPREGLEIIRARRGEMPDKNLTSGPGKLCRAFAIDKSYNGEHLEGERIWLESGIAISSERIASGPRIGVDYAGEDALMPLRFWVRDSPYISKR
jgi:DNA-3-methyladenine glycosylase